MTVHSTGRASARRVGLDSKDETKPIALAAKQGTSSPASLTPVVPPHHTMVPKNLGMDQIYTTLPHTKTSKDSSHHQTLAHSPSPKTQSLRKH